MITKKSIVNTLWTAIVVLAMLLYFVTSLIILVNAVSITSIHPVADAWVRADEPNTNYGADSRLSLRNADYNVDRIAYLKFDLSSIPTGATITRAVFRAYLSDKGGGRTAQVGVHFVSDNTWKEYEITWNNAPSYSINPTYINSTVAVEGVWYTWTVTSDVSKALQTRLYSFALVSEFNSDIDSFGSRESANKPALQIEYTVPDANPPVIGVPFRTPSENIAPDQQVKISVSITDAESGVKNATLRYTVNDGPTWTNLPMNYNSASGYYEGIIPSQAKDTWVKFDIIAYDNAENKAVQNNNGQYFTYQVTATLDVTVIANPTIVQSTQTSTITTRVTYGGNPISDAIVTLSFEPYQAGTLSITTGNTDTNGYFTSTFTAPTVTTQTTITITANATKTGYLSAQRQTQITVNPSQPQLQPQPDLTLWIFLAIVLVVFINISAWAVIAKRKGKEPKEEEK